ncbi:hypothetical protein [Halosimplex sp. TS25]|uniref:hypothetical protein n=1 Tax=Halosimplex rarum TaxID=3396619 RepID=UPI0039E774B7
MLAEDTQPQIQAALRTLLATKDPSDEFVEITSGLPLAVSQLNVTYYVDGTLGFELFVEHPEEVTLVTDDVVGCAHHAPGDPLSTLGELGDDYEALEKDLLETVAVMVDLPEHPDDREQYVYGDLAFTNSVCYDGNLIFTLLYEPGKHVRGLYQGAAFGVGRRIGIPVEPETTEMVEEE